MLTAFQAGASGFFVYFLQQNTEVLGKGEIMNSE